MITHIFDGKLIRFHVFLGDIMNCSNGNHLNTAHWSLWDLKLIFSLLKSLWFFSFSLFYIQIPKPLFQSHRTNIFFFSVQFIRLRARAVVLRHSFALNITIMDRITLFDIEINTLFEFAYNLFFVYSVSFSKRLMNKAKPDDIQLWRKSEYKLSLQCDPSEVDSI